MRIKIECECGETYEVDPSDIFYHDTTPCSCGRCYGESYEISFGDCPKCKKENVVEK